MILLALSVGPEFEGRIGQAAAAAELQTVVARLEVAIDTTAGTGLPTVSNLTLSQPVEISCTGNMLTGSVGTQTESVELPVPCSAFQLALAGNVSVKVSVASGYITVGV
jgi:hypothetical protein